MLGLFSAWTCHFDRIIGEGAGSSRAKIKQGNYKLANTQSGNNEKRAGDWKIQSTRQNSEWPLGCEKDDENIIEVQCKMTISKF